MWGKWNEIPSMKERINNKIIENRTYLKNTLKINANYVDNIEDKNINAFTAILKRFQKLNSANILSNYKIPLVPIWGNEKRAFYNYMITRGNLQTKITLLKRATVKKSRGITIIIEGLEKLNKAMERDKKSINGVALATQKKLTNVV